MDSPTRIPRHKAPASTGGHSRISSVTSLMAEDGAPGLRTLSRSSTTRTNVSTYNYSTSPPPVQDLGQRVLVHWDRGIDISSAGQHIMTVLRKIWGAEQQLLIKQTTLDNRRKKTAPSSSTPPSPSSSSSSVNVLLAQATNEVSKWEEILRRYELELDGLVFKRFQLVRVKAQAGKHVPQGAGRVYIKAPGFSLPKAEVKRIRGGAGKTQQTSTQQVRPATEVQGEENEGSINQDPSDLTDSACELGSDGHESDHERNKEILGDGYEDLDGADNISISDNNVITPQGTCIVCNTEVPQFTPHILPEKQQNAVIQLNEFELDSEKVDGSPMMCLVCLSKLWDQYGTAASQVAAAHLAE